MKNWKDLYEWQKHVIVLTIILIFGFISVRAMTYRGILTPIDEMAWNVILNLVALGYAVYAFYLYDKEAEKMVERFKEMHIDPPSWEGLAFYLTKNLKPLFDIWEESDMNDEDIRKMVKKLKIMAERTDIVMDEKKVMDEIEAIE